jgi:hypothetical protein
MNDLEILDEVWDAPAPPPPEAYAEARAALLAKGRAPAPARRRVPPRGALAVGLAVAVILAVGVAQNLTGSDRAVPVASAAEVLQRAADAAERRPFTAPRDGQWIYTEERITGVEGGRTHVMRSWRRADGEFELRTGLRATGRPVHMRPRGPLDSYEAAAALPADPTALLQWAKSQTESISGAGSTPDAEVYSIFRGILHGNGVLPPDVEAAIFHAMRRIPGVTVRTIDVLGRPTLALAMTDEWLRQEILVDPETYAYVGQRSTVVEDAIISPEKAGNATGEIEKGSAVVAVRVAAGVVDEAGERP